MRNVRHIISLLLIACLATACRDLYSTPQINRDTNRIVPDVRTSTVGTKSADTASRTFRSEDGAMLINEYVSWQEDTPHTKGAELTTGTINRFTVDALIDSEDPATGDPVILLNGASCVRISDGWQWADADPRWVDDKYIHFWGKHIPENVDIDNISSGKDRMTFSYESPETGNDDFFNSGDLALSYNKEKRTLSEDGKEITGGGSDKYNVTFKHALAAICFTVNPTGLADDVNVKYIKLKGIYGSGTCVAAGSGEGESATIAYTWTPTGDKRDFKQVVSTTKNATDGRTKLIDGDFAKGSTMMLFIVPQELEEVEIEVQFAKHGYTSIRSVKLSDVAWEAGYYYTYGLSAIVHAPGDEIPINQDFSIKGFMNDPLHTRYIPETGYYEAVGVTIIGVKITHTYKDTSGKSTGYIYAVSSDGSKDTKGTSVTYDFRPVPSVPNWPYNGGDGIEETYSGYTQMTATGDTPVDEYYVYNIDGFNYFRLAMFANGAANNAKWNGTYVKTYVLEMNGVELE